MVIRHSEADSSIDVTEIFILKHTAILCVGLGCC